MDTQALREVYKSIGITDKDGKFPIGKLTEQARQIDETSQDMKTNLTAKFALLKKWCPEFATCQNSTIEVLEDVLLENNEKFNFTECISSRVYDKSDPEKKAVLFVCIEFENGERYFFYANKQEGEMVHLSQEEFGAKFEFYEEDLKKMKDKEAQKNKETSSGQVTAEEGR